MLITTLVALVLLIAWNALACMHALAMTRFVGAGPATSSPEALTAWGKLRTLILGVRIPRPVNRRTPAELGLNYTSLTFHNPHGTKLGAWLIPATNADTIVVLLHGYGAEKSALLDEAAAFHDLGCACLLVDFPGSGESSGHRTTIGYREAQDVDAIVTALRASHPGVRIVLFGQSMGAAAILRSIHAHATAPDAIILEAVFDTMLRTVKNRFECMRVPSFPSAHFLTFWGGVAMGANAFRHNPQRYARSVRVPALVLHGSHDPRARLEDGRRVFDALQGPRHMHVFDGVKHESFFASQPAEWRAQVSAFLQTRASAT